MILNYQNSSKARIPSGSVEVCKLATLTSYPDSGLPEIQSGRTNKYTKPTKRTKTFFMLKTSSSIISFS